LFRQTGFPAWIVGGLLSFFGALTYAELGAIAPKQERVVYVAMPMDRFPHFVCMDLVSDRQTSFFATVTTGFVRILRDFPRYISLFIIMGRTSPSTYGSVRLAPQSSFRFFNYIWRKESWGFSTDFTC